MLSLVPKPLTRIRPKQRVWKLSPDIFLITSYLLRYVIAPDCYVSRMYVCAMLHMIRWKRIHTSSSSFQQGLEVTLFDKTSLQQTAEAIAILTQGRE